MNFSALASQPEDICNSWETSDQNYILISVDLGLSLVTLVYFAFKPEDAQEDPALPMLEMAQLSGSPTSPYSNSSDSKQKTSESAAQFHTLMMAFGMSIGLLLSNWGLEGGWRSYLSFGVRESQVLLISLLFLWSLLAPKCCPERDFDLN